MYLFIAMTSFSLGCKSPPDAPETLDDLASYLFLHMADEDPEALLAGLDNLDVWLDKNSEAAVDGYKVTNLSEEAVESLGLEYEPEGLVGAAVGYDIAHPVEDVVAVMMLAKSDPDAEPSGELYSREYLEGDRDCFAIGDCLNLEYTSHSADFLPMGLTVESWTQTQHRRIPTEDDDRLLQRSWMTEPAVSNYDWLSIDQQYWIATLTPWGKKSRRVEAGWVVLRLAEMPVPEDVALNIAINEMRGMGEYYENYIAEKGVPQPGD